VFCSRFGRARVDGACRMKLTGMPSLQQLLVQQINKNSAPMLTLSRTPSKTRKCEETDACKLASAMYKAARSRQPCVAIDAGQGQPDELDKADASSSRPGVAREVPGTADAPVGSRVAVKPARSGQTRQRMLRQELQAVTRVVLS